MRGHEDCGFHGLCLIRALIHHDLDCFGKAQELLEGIELPDEAEKRILDGPV